MFTLEDKEKIKMYINENAEAAISSLEQVDKVLTCWEKEKSKFLFKLFGNKLILNKEFCYEESKEEKIDKFLELINKNLKAFNFFENVKRILYNELNFNLKNLSTLTSLDKIIDNIYTGEDFTIDNLSFKKGEKILKIYRKISEHFNIEDFKEFEKVFSLSLNNKKIKGLLSLSIHPLDYMTMSDNDSNWDSCMSWTNDGGYKAGTIEMMNSPMVVVAYIHNPNSQFFFDYKQRYSWNNKKWRSLYIINDQIISNVKGYPYQNSAIDAEVMNWLRELAKENLNLEYSDEILNIQNGLPFDFKGKEMKVTYRTNLMYNDCNRQKIFLSTNLDVNNLYVNYSGPMSCIECGETNLEFFSDKLVCADCAGLARCENCGEYYYREELYSIGNSLLCGYCADLFVEDFISGKPILKEDSLEIAIKNDEDVFLNYIYLDYFYNYEKIDLYELSPEKFKLGTYIKYDDCGELYINNKQLK